jgi:hypothetical protein
LFGWGYVQKDFRNPNTVRDHHAFEFIDLFVASLPFVLAGETLHPLDQNSPVPGAIENNDLSRIGELFPKSLQIVAAAFVR